MKAIEVLEHLKYGEMANTFSAKKLLDPQESKAQAYSYINRALTELNKEFYLNQAEFIIPLVVNRVKYFITSANSMKVIAAFKSDGTELTLNSENNPDFALFTPDLNTVEYHGENKASDTVKDYISLIYLKNFNKIREDRDTIPVSEPFLSSLLAYVGYLAQYSTGAGKDQSTSRMLKARYAECLSDLYRLGYNQDNYTTLDRLDKRGFL